MRVPTGRASLAVRWTERLRRTAPHPKNQGVIGEGRIHDEVEKLSVEENLKRRHLYCSLQNEKKVSKRKYSHRIIGAKHCNGLAEKSNQHCKTAKLIPELSKLLNKGKINQESASVYAKVSLENQRRIYCILMKNGAQRAI